jgi:hypothetical protein
MEEIMTKKENYTILFALVSLADKLYIKDTELSSTEKITNKFNKVIEENKNIFSNQKEFKEEIIKLFNKYVNKLDNKKGG